jgi:hypothetical protein
MGARLVGAAWTPGRTVLWLLALSLLARLLAMLASGAGLHVDEAQYWDWSRRLAWGYWSKPPVVAGLIAASTGLFGDGVAGVRLLAMACWPLAAWMVYLTGRFMGGACVGVWAAVLFIGTPAAGLLGMVATTDAPLMLCWSTAMYCTWRALCDEEVGRRAWRWWLLAGLAAGAGLLSKYTMAAFALSAAWLAGRRRDLRPGVGVAAACALLVFAPHLAWNAAHGWPTLAHTAQITVQASARKGLEALLSVLEFAGGQFLMLGPVVWVVASRVLAAPGEAATQRPASRAHPAAATFALVFTLPLLAIGLLQAAHAKAQVNWAAPFLVGACLWLGLRAAPLLQGRRVLAAWSAGLVIAAAVSLLGTLLGAQRDPAARPPRVDVWARMRGWDHALRDLAPSLRSHPTLPIATTSRDLVAQASYAWRDLGREVTAWPAPGVARNHFELLRPLRQGTQPWPAQVLVLAGAAPDERMRSAYREWRLLASARAGGADVQLWIANQPVSPP